jgi:hypothetical protein
MKSLNIILVLFCLVFQLRAQKKVELLKDETGKYTYYEVVASQVPSDSLRLRMLDFIAKKTKELKLQRQSEAGVVALGKMVIHKSLYVASHPTGEISYQFNFEQALNKYRFWLTDFQFIPYAKDRYGNFVPSTTIATSLEKEVGKSAKEQWEDYKQQVADYAGVFAEELKLRLASSGKAAPKIEEKKVISKTW